MEAILVTGGDGQLGRCLGEVLAGSYEVVLLSREDFDLLEPATFGQFLSGHSYKAVVNCAAYTAVDKAESEPDVARAVNTTAVGIMAAYCATAGVPLIHISSDYVYDNGLDRPLLEADPVNPRSVYALTKLGGERAAQMAWEKTFILRTSWVYSEYGHNFVKTMLRLGRRGIAPSVVTDQVGSPTYARDLAGAVKCVIDKLDASAPGVYNFSNTGQTSWFQFARAVFAAGGFDLEISPITTKDYGAPAQRPYYSVLDSSRFTKTFDCHPRSWQEAFDDCIARMSEDTQDDN